MTRATMRALLRRRLQDSSADTAAENWSDSELNELLNQGLIKAQKAVLAVDPLAFIAIDKQDVEEDEEMYAKPDGFWYMRQLQILNETTGLYEPIEKEDYEIARAGAATSTRVTWSDFGRFIALRPVPSAAIRLGLRWIYVVTLAMGADNDVPALHQGLHTLPVWFAQRLAIGETGETDAGMKEVEGLIAADLADIPDYYRSTNASADFLVPRLHKGF